MEAWGVSATMSGLWVIPREKSEKNTTNFSLDFGPKKSKVLVI